MFLAESLSFTQKKVTKGQFYELEALLLLPYFEGLLFFVLALSSQKLHFSDRQLLF
jgi:hypothetical protein